MGKIRTIDDITKDQEEKERKEIKKRLSEMGVLDMNSKRGKQLVDEIINQSKQRRKDLEEKNRKKKKYEFFATIIAYLIGITITLGCIYLIKIFIGGIF